MMALILALVISSEMKTRSLFMVLLLALIPFSGVSAKGVYQKPAAFVAETLDKAHRAPLRLRMSGELAARVKTILGHRYPRSRLRYWRAGDKTVWILQEIGKEKPITVGIVVDGGAIARVKVLAFRESRGDEVRFPSFVRQYEHAALTGGDYKLDKSIDGITGATLSVRAVNKLARLALLLHQTVTKNDKTP